MSILSRSEIIEARTCGYISIDPWSDASAGPASISLHLGDNIVRLDAVGAVSVDQPSTYPSLTPIGLDPKGYIPLEKGNVLLASTLEHIGLPNNIAGWLTGTSDLARLGVQVVLSDFVAPGFGSARPGVLALELVSHTAKIVYLRPRMRIAHLVLMALSEAPDTGYDDIAEGYSGSSNILPSQIYKRLR